MINKQLSMLFLIMTAILTACNTYGTGNIITETRTVDNFEQLSLSIHADVILTQGKETSLQIEAEDDLIDKIQTTVRNGELSIELKRGFLSLSPTKPIKIYVTMQDITGLDIQASGDIVASEINTHSLNLQISGSGNMDIEGITTDALNIDISGSGDAEIDAVTADTLNIDISGSGDIEINEGATTEQTTRISGSGGYHAKEVQGEVAFIRISGSGNVETWVQESLEVNISGSGDVSYYGRPNVTQNIYGSGSIRNLGGE